MNILNPYSLSSEDINAFQHTGFLKLKNLFTKPFISHLKQLFKHERALNNGSSGKTNLDFHSYHYDFGKNDALIRQLCLSPEFRQLLTHIYQGQLIFTMGAGFEIAPENKGYFWHYDILSFCYIRPSDMGLSLWIPLDEIDVNAQHGGMSYIPQHYRLTEGDLLDNITQVVMEGVPASMAAKKTSDNFALGDALLFNKYVMHQSECLKPGPLKSRTAFTLRFIDRQACFSSQILEKIKLFVKSGLGYTNLLAEANLLLQSFADIAEGAPLNQSRYFSEWMHLT